MSNRALRALELFGEDSLISAEEFEKYKYDMRYSDKSYMSKFVDRIISISKKFKASKLLYSIWCIPLGI